MTFKGFLSNKSKLTPIPEPFFSELLPIIDNLYELKIILYAFWFLNQQQNNAQYLTEEDFLSDQTFIAILHPEPQEALQDALALTVQHNILLKTSDSQHTYYFLNTPRGRAAVNSIEKGNWTPEQGSRADVNLDLIRPNLFELYEENIGPLTPMISETLRDAETTYPESWIEEAIQIAVEKNVRNWRYIDAILKSWRKEGRNEKDRRDTKENRRKYIEGEYGDIIEH